MHPPYRGAERGGANGRAPRLHLAAAVHPGGCRAPRRRDPQLPAYCELLADTEEAEDLPGGQRPKAAEEARTARAALADVVEVLGAHGYPEAGDATGGLGLGIRTR